MYIVDRQAPNPQLGEHERSGKIRSTVCRLADIAAKHKCCFADEVCKLWKEVNDDRLKPQCEMAREGCARARERAKKCAS
jgi:hypothetical protein